MITVRLPEDIYQEVVCRQRGEDILERALTRGLRSYLEHPKKTRLLMDGTTEERLEDLLLMLAQTRASYGVLRTWEVSDEEDHTSSREEYTILADELQRMERGPLAQLEREIKALSAEIGQLEAELRARGGDPEGIEPPFPVGVNRIDYAPAPEPGGLRRLWHRVSRGILARTGAHKGG